MNGERSASRPAAAARCDQPFGAGFLVMPARPVSLGRAVAVSGINNSSPGADYGYFFSISSKNASDSRANASAFSRISSPALSFRIEVSGL